jgi:glycine/D-amino acid oxidase-like deaminating enzyme
MKIAVIGSGINGLMTAYRLSDNHANQVHVYEKDPSYKTNTSYNSPANITVYNLNINANYILKSGLSDIKSNLSTALYAAIRSGKVDEVDYYQSIIDFVADNRGLDTGIHLSQNIVIFNTKSRMHDFIDNNGPDTCRIMSNNELDAFRNHFPEVWGVEYRDGGKIDSHVLCDFIYNKCLENNVRFHFNTEIDDIHVEENKITYIQASKSKIQASKSKIQASKFVFCIENPAKALFAKLNIQLPLFKMYGYTETFDEKLFNGRTIIVDMPDKLFISTANGKTRVGGGFFLSDNHQQFKKTVLNIFKEQQSIREWQSSRCVTPDTCPIIDKLFSNCWINCGQGFRGMTNTFAHSEELANMVTLDTPSKFKLRRFNNNIMKNSVALAILFTLAILVVRILRQTKTFKNFSKKF